MDDALQNLIGRLEAALSDPQQKPLWLHWSDVELLRATLLELEGERARVRNMANAIDLVLKGALREGTR